MKFLIFFVGTVFSVSALTDLDQWNSFKAKHLKSYTNVVEENLRFDIFQKNLRTIEEHNTKYDQGLVSYYMGVNQFTDKTSEEFKKILVNQKLSKPTIKTTEKFTRGNQEVPQIVDWRDQGAVLEVKNQGDCGSCWAFSSTGALEAQNFIVNNVSLPLSEQQLIDCSTEYGNGDCIQGGIMRYAFRYLQDYGLLSDQDYPYKAQQGARCKYDEKKISLSKISGFVEIQPMSEEALINAIATFGPVALAINAEPLQNYAGGIIDDDAEKCPNLSYDINHGVLGIGYNLTGNYYILKNSWGTNWGENGFFRMVKGIDVCGITRDASVPILE